MTKKRFLNISIVTTALVVLTIISILLGSEFTNSKNLLRKETQAVMQW